MNLVKVSQERLDAMRKRENMLRARGEGSIMQTEAEKEHYRKMLLLMREFEKAYEEIGVVPEAKREQTIKAIDRKYKAIGFVYNAQKREDERLKKLNIDLNDYLHQSKAIGGLETEPESYTNQMKLGMLQDSLQRKTKREDDFIEMDKKSRTLRARFETLKALGVLSKDEQAEYGRIEDWLNVIDGGLAARDKRLADLKETFSKIIVGAISREDAIKKLYEILDKKYTFLNEYGSSLLMQKASVLPVHVSAAVDDAKLMLPSDNNDSFVGHRVRVNDDYLKAKTFIEKDKRGRLHDSEQVMVDQVKIPLPNQTPLHIEGLALDPDLLHAKHAKPLHTRRNAVMEDTYLLPLEQRDHALGIKSAKELANQPDILDDINARPLSPTNFVYTLYPDLLFPQSKNVPQSGPVNSNIPNPPRLRATPTGLPQANVTPRPNPISVPPRVRSNKPTPAAKKDNCIIS